MSVYSAGSNSSYGLGRECGSTSYIPAKIARDFMSLISFAAYKRTFFVFSDGSVETCGKEANDYSDVNEKDALSKIDGLIDGNYKVVFVTCSKDYTIFIDREGQMLVILPCMDDDVVKLNAPEPILFASSYYVPWAVGKSGAIYEFGFDFNEEPKKYVLDRPVYEVHQNQNSVVCITNDFRAFGKGKVVEKQNSGKSEKSDGFVEIESLKNKKIIKFAVSSTHILCIDIEGRAYSFGENDKCQLGIIGKVNDNEIDDDENGKSKEILDFEEITTLKDVKIKSIACGEKYSLFVDEGGAVYGCGRAKDGQLFSKMTETTINKNDDEEIEGIDEKELKNKFSVPTKMDRFLGSSKAVEVACGENFSFAFVDGNPFVHKGMEALVDMSIFEKKKEENDDRKKEFCQAEVKPKNSCCLLI